MREHLTDEDLYRISAALVSGKQRELRAIELLERFKIEGADTFIMKLTSSENAEVRARAMELLGGIKCRKDSINALVCGLRDPDILVRSTAAQSLGEARSNVALNPLLRALEDRSDVVRSAAAITLGRYGAARVLVEIVEHLRREKVASVKLRLFGAMYLLGKRDILPSIVAFLSDKNYRNRCAAANILPEIVTLRDRSFVSFELTGSLEKETTAAARSSIKHALQRLKKLNR